MTIITVTKATTLEEMQVYDGKDGALLRTDGLWEEVQFRNFEPARVPGHLFRVQGFSRWYSIPPGKQIRFND